MTSALAEALPDMDAAERTKLVPLAAGSVGRAIAFAELDLMPLEADATAIMRQGDPDNSRRGRLASTLALKAAAPRYAAFLELVPTLVAREARASEGARRERALKAYEQAREAVALAPRLSLDAAATCFQLGTILASVAGSERGG
jgi:DNA polymerase-3 subunit delta'